MPIQPRCTFRVASALALSQEQQQAVLDELLRIVVR